MSTVPSHHRIRQRSQIETDNVSRLNVFVLYTGVRETLCALRRAAQLAAGLDLCVEIIVPQVVPYPLPVNKPQASPSIVIRRFKTIAESTGIESTIRVCLCRDQRDALNAVLVPGSIVVIGCRRCWWWPTRENQIARWLRAASHRVVFTDARADAPEYPHA